MAEEGVVDFSSLQGKTLTGQVKTFNAKMNRGFVQCEQVEGKDIYVHGSVLQKAGANVGDMVEFGVHINKEGLPQASSPMKVIGSGIHTAQHAGRIKSFSEKSGYGFVECPELREEFGRDVFLPFEMAATLNGAYPGEEVVFNINLNREGQPTVSQIWPVDEGKGGKGGKGYDKGCGKGKWDDWGGKGKWDDWGGKGKWDDWGGKGKSDDWGGKGKWSDGQERRSATQYAPGFEPANRAKGKGAAGAPAKKLAPKAAQKRTDEEDNSLNELDALIDDLNADVGSDEEVDGEAFVGKVKSFNAAMGYGFVECEETFAEFGHDIQIPKGVTKNLKAGEKVSFKIDMNDEGMPVVVEISSSKDKGGAKRKAPEAAGGAKKMQKVAAKPAAKQSGGLAAEDDEELLDEELGGELDAAGDGETYEGEIVSFDIGSGRGFIACEGVKATMDQDVYVHRKVLAQGKANVGDVVRFTIHVNKQGLPQASHPLQVVKKSRGPKLEHRGLIKSFSEKKGYGFVECPATFEQHGRDVYMPGSKARNTYVGQEVYFSVDLNNDGMPVVHEMYPVVIEDVKGGGKGGKDWHENGGKGKDSGKWGKGDDWGAAKGYGKGYDDMGYGGKGYGGDWGKGGGGDLSLGAFGGGSSYGGWGGKGGGWDDPWSKGKGGGAKGPKW